MDLNEILDGISGRQHRTFCSCGKCSAPIRKIITKLREQHIEPTVDMVLKYKTDKEFEEMDKRASIRLSFESFPPVLTTDNLKTIEN